MQIECIAEIVRTRNDVQSKETVEFTITEEMLEQLCVQYLKNNHGDVEIVALARVSVCVD